MGKQSRAELAAFALAPQSQKKPRRSHAHRSDGSGKQDKSLLHDPIHWATLTESRIKGVLQQVSQNFDTDHQLRVMLEQMCNDLHCYAKDELVNCKTILVNESNS